LKGRCGADQIIAQITVSIRARCAVFQQMIADTTQAPTPFDAIAMYSRSRFFRELFQF